MKKITALLLLVLCLVLAGCGQAGNAPVTQVPGERVDPAPQITLIPDEKTGEVVLEFAEPTTVSEVATPEGVLITNYLDANGNSIQQIGKFPDGSYYEHMYYPNGFDKSHVEYAADGTIISESKTDEHGNPVYSYEKTEDGTIREEYYENGNLTISSEQWTDGGLSEEHYESGIIVFSYYQQADGTYDEAYYENGVMIKSMHGYCNEREMGYYSERFYINGIEYKSVFKNSEGEYTEEYDTEGNVLFSVHNHLDGSTFETYYESGKRVCVIAKNTDGTFIEWYSENDVQVKYVEGRFNEAGVRVSETVNDMKNKVYREYKRNDAGIVTFYYWTDYVVERTYYFDDSGLLVKYVEKIDHDEATITDPTSWHRSPQIWTWRTAERDRLNWYLTYSLPAVSLRGAKRRGNLLHDSEMQ